MYSSPCRICFLTFDIVRTNGQKVKSDHYFFLDLPQTKNTDYRRLKLQLLF